MKWKAFALLAFWCLSSCDALHASPCLGQSVISRVRGTAPVALAKKKGGGGKKKGGSKQKKSGFEWAASFELKPTESQSLRELVELVVASYKTRAGKGLPTTRIDPGADIPKAIWNLKSLAVLVMADAKPEAQVETEEGNAGELEDVAEPSAGPAGPVCTYANPAAAEAFGYPGFDGFKALIDKPCPELPVGVGGGKKFEGGFDKKLSRRPGAPILESEAGGGALEAEVTLKDVERWSLEKMAIVDGKLASEVIGVAYCFPAWQLSDGTTCKPGAVREAAAIDPEEVQAKVEAQAATVRRLKEEEGLANDDEAVQEAVQELLRLKTLL